MHIALISDIHGNAVALDAVLADIAQQSIDQIVCLGDVATLGPQPHEVIVRLKECGCLGIVGNHDRNMFDPEFLEQFRATYESRVLEATTWCKNLLLPEDVDYLRTYVPHKTFDLGQGLSLLGYHGSPSSCRDVILVSTPAAGLEAHFSRYEATVLAGGHTHVQMLRRYGRSLLINPGSVGQPFACFPFTGKRPHIFPWAEYGIVSQVKGVLSVDLRRVPVDKVAVRKSVISSGFPLKDVLLGAM